VQSQVTKKLTEMLAGCVCRLFHVPSILPAPSSWLLKLRTTWICKYKRSASAPRIHVSLAGLCPGAADLCLDKHDGLRGGEQLVVHLHAGHLELVHLLPGRHAVPEVEPVDGDARKLAGHMVHHGNAHARQIDLE
jgi:hypothetical protein